MYTEITTETTSHNKELAREQFHTLTSPVSLYGADSVQK